MVRPPKKTVRPKTIQFSAVVRLGRLVVLFRFGNTYGYNSQFWFPKSWTGLNLVSVQEAQTGRTQFESNLLKKVGPKTETQCW